ncbi:MAG: hypothetical protein QXR45_14810 [Candidatus Bathyarchaeia archaeon]
MITREKILKIWLGLLLSYLLIVAMILVMPFFKTAVNQIFEQLNLATYGLAGSILFVFLSIGIGVTLYYLIVITRAMRSKTSALHIASSTMHLNMFGGEAERRARETLANFRASPEPHVILLVPTDKRISGRFVREIKR